MIHEELGHGLFTLEPVLTPEECQYFIDLSERVGYEEATITTHRGPVMNKRVRDNERVLYKDEAMAEALYQKFIPYLPVLEDGSRPVGLNELFRFYRYEGSQRFMTHRDGAYERNASEASRFSLLVYLNDTDGGQTEFGDLKVFPKAGKALVFLHEYRHKGCAVDSGMKYVLRTDVMYRLS